jgi:hypothetical protein
MLPAFEVHPYSDGAFKKALTDASHCGDREALEKKPQVTYLANSLKHLKAQTLLIEHWYVDRDFLEDYAAHYARCFEEYPRFCRRVHAFSGAFSEDALKALIQNEPGNLTADAFSGSYLGFVVVRPLPYRLIGRTCLRPPTLPEGAQFPAIRNYRVHLFGIDLEFPSLAFQEQDREVAACATSALWSLFQSTGATYQHHMPSPVEVTRAATKHAADVNRVFPNVGLSPRQQGGGDQCQCRSGRDTRQNRSENCEADR